MKYQIFLVHDLAVSPFAEIDDKEHLINTAREVAIYDGEHIAIKEEGRTIHYLPSRDYQSMKALKDGNYDASHAAWLRVSNNAIHQ